MSYDLYLYRREGAKPLKKKGFQDYFKGRTNFTLKGIQAHYHNEKTGVYFTFDYNDGKGKDSDPEDPHAVHEHIYLNVNYFRPHIFGLEVERILTALVKDLDLVVSDPQNEGMGDGEYTPEGFLRGWNAGNRFGHQAYLAMEQKGETLIPQHHVLPAKTLRACWEWTYGIDALYEHFHADDIDVFIPRVMYALCDGKLQTLCVWPQLIPMALPVVDLVLVMRNELPKRFAKGVDPANAVVPWKEVRKAASAFEVISGKKAPGLKYLLLDYGKAENAPPELVEFVRRLPAFSGQLQLIATDQILDEELVRECAPKPRE
ncbi:MAG TPA: hypothetical protein VEL76_07850 [Gemmataceae bacterium]|nr:hypothetical protein [Gemmataceae bacterium]